MTLTALGKELRKARIDTDDTVEDMATAVGISPQTLMAVEHGTKQIATDLIDALIDYLKSKGVAVGDLHTLAVQSNSTVQKYRSLATEIMKGKLSDTQINQIKNIMGQSVSTEG
jgi:DNA-binding XRE family transcriptional regulator